MEYARAVTLDYAQAFRSGLTITQVGEKFGVTREQARSVLKRAGLTRRDGGAYVRAAQRSEKLIALMEEMGCGPGEAARILGIPAPPEAIEWARDFRDQRAITRFWSRVDSSGGPDACHPWTGTRYPTGYGLCRGALQRITGAQYAHRVAFILANGRQPSAPTLFKGASCVLHSCDNPPCCNPRHLREGTMADNMKDRDARGRHGMLNYKRTPEQMESRNSKLRGLKRTPEQIARIKAGQRKAKREGRGIAAWWKSLTPEQRAAHSRNVQVGRAQGAALRSAKE